MAKKKKKPQKKTAPQAAPKRSEKGWNIALIAIGVLILALLVFIVARAAKQTPETIQTTASTEAAEAAANEAPVEEAPVEEPAAEPAEEPTVSSDFDTSLTYYADIDIADYGTVTVQLDAQAAPITVENFVDLANSGFYNGLTFHRIMEGFMMQGGDPTGTGSGGAGWNIKGEFSANGVENNLSHTRGAISMARATDFDSASSQFFLVHQDSTFLDGSYACFGYVTEGMEYVDAVCENAEPTDDNGTIPPEAQPVINSVTIRTE